MTFTPAWGKRSGAHVDGDGANGQLPMADVPRHGDNGFPDRGYGGCGEASSDSLMLVYHIIQLEAHKLLECQSKSAGGF